MAYVQGLTDTGDVTAARLVAPVSDKIHLLEPDKAPLMKMLGDLPSKPAGGINPQWQTDELAPKSDTLAEALDTSETDIDVTDGTKWQKNDIMKVVETGETMIVQSVSSNTVTVVARSNGTVAGTAAATGGVILNLGKRFAEGATLRVSASDDTYLNKYVQTVTKTNYTEIKRTPVALSRTQTQVNVHGPDERAYQRKKAGIEHMRDWELVAFHGENSATTRTAGGVIEYIDSSNNFDTSTLTEEQFNLDCADAFRYGSKKKVLFTSYNVSGIMSGWASPKSRVAPGGDKLGNRVRFYEADAGDVLIVPTYSLEGGQLDRYAVMVDMADVCRRPLQDTVLRVDVHERDRDGIVDEYLTEQSFEWSNGKFHAIWDSIIA